MAQIERKWIENGAINHTKLDSSDSYSMASLVTTGGVVVGGTLGVSGDSTVSALRVTSHSQFDGPVLFNGGTSETDSTVVGNEYVTGRVGIGSSNPQEKLDVFGTVRAFTTGATTITAGSTTADADNALYGDFQINNYATTSLEPRLVLIRGRAQGLTANERGGKLEIWTKRDGVSSPMNPAVTINNLGNIGIGTTTNPSAKLDVVATSLNNILRIKTTDAVEVRVLIEDVNGGLLTLSKSETLSIGSLIKTSDASPLRLGTSGTERMRIDPAGNVGVGTTNPGGQIQIDTLSLTTPAVIANAYSTSYADKVLSVNCSRPPSAAFNLIYCTSAGGAMMRVDGLGRIWSTYGASVSTPADLAEWTKVGGDLSWYDVGTVVMQDPDQDMTVVKATSQSDAVYGIVTDRATFCGGLVEGLTDKGMKKDLMKMDAEEFELKYKAKRIAMSGHVACKVTGIIHRGQKLCLSNISGVARAAIIESEKMESFAIARQSWSGEGVGLIEVRLL